MPSDEIEVIGQLTADTIRLVLEAYDALSADRWAITNNGSPITWHRLYDAAALRHTCSQLRSTARAALDEDELAVRILPSACRSLLTATYVHFGAYKMRPPTVSDQVRRKTASTRPRMTASLAGTRPFQDHDVRPRVVNGRSMDRLAHRAASVTSVRPKRRRAQIARLRSEAMILGPDRVLTCDLSSCAVPEVVQSI